MNNGFHLVRAVFFALLVLFSLLTLAFSAWNINLSLKADVPASATAIFMLFESCSLLLCVTLGLLESLFPSVRTSTTVVECAWTVTLSFFQLGAAISASINGPTFYCQSTLDTRLCGSASLLVQAVWLKTAISFAYFFTLLITILSHRAIVDNIWGETIYTVDWFDISQEQIFQPKKEGFFWEKGSARSHKLSSSLDDIESARSLKDLGFIDNTNNTSAPWANKTEVKRGVDAPFSVASTHPTPATSPAFVSKTLPPIPFTISTPRSSFAPSRFVERFRESRLLSRTETTTQYGKHFINTPAQFPSTLVLDHDMPIPKPYGCEWVRADALRSPC